MGLQNVGWNFTTSDTNQLEVRYQIHYAFKKKWADYLSIPSMAYWYANDTQFIAGV